MSRPKRRLLIAGGGTGGHILPGVALADAWQKRFGADAGIVFVGARGALEERLVPRAGYSLRTLRIGSLKRVSLLRRLRTLVQLPISILSSFVFLLRWRPEAVIGVGGYASGPLVFVAGVSRWLWGGRVAILEPNSVPGMTNRWLSRLAQKIFASFPGTETYFAPAVASRLELLGTPIRESLKPLPSAPRHPFGIFIFGGSQGSVPINTLVIEALPHMKDLFGRVRILHQTGERDFERVAEAHRLAGSGARVEKFIYDMPAAYAEASLLICRAGASTLAEIAAVRRAALLIPLPTAADNHQFKNAEVYARAGAAILLEQGRASGESLAREIRALVSAPARVQAIEGAVASFYRPGAAEQLIESLLR